MPEPLITDEVGVFSGDYEVRLLLDWQRCVFNLSTVYFRGILPPQHTDKFEESESIRLPYRILDIDSLFPVAPCQVGFFFPCTSLLLSLQ